MAMAAAPAQVRQQPAVTSQVQQHAALLKFEDVFKKYDCEYFASSYASIKGLTPTQMDAHIKLYEERFPFIKPYLEHTLLDTLRKAKTPGQVQACMDIATDYLLTSPSNGDYTALLKDALPVLLSAVKPDTDMKLVTRLAKNYRERFHEPFSHVGQMLPSMLRIAKDEKELMAFDSEVKGMVQDYASRSEATDTYADTSTYAYSGVSKVLQDSTSLKQFEMARQVLIDVFDRSGNDFGAMRSCALDTLPKLMKKINDKGQPFKKWGDKVIPFVLDFSSKFGDQLDQVERVLPNLFRAVKSEAQLSACLDVLKSYKPVLEPDSNKPVYRYTALAANALPALVKAAKSDAHFVAAAELTKTFIEEFSEAHIYAEQTYIYAEKMLPIMMQKSASPAELKEWDAEARRRIRDRSKGESPSYTDLKAIINKVESSESLRHFKSL